MNNRFHRAILMTIALAATLFISGCIDLGGSNQTQTTTANDKIKTYETSAFTISIPTEWEMIDAKQFTADVPKETIVVFRNNVKNETFTANIVIVKNSLQEPVDTLEYAKMVLNRQSTGLYDYKESRREEAKISIGGKDAQTFFTDFQAKKTAAENTVRYLQTYGVKDNAAYIVTGAASTKENDSIIKTIEDTVKSFKLK
jgi:hypothetical protein